MPTSKHEEEEVDKVYESIEKRSENTKGKDYTIIMGDWNASVGEGEEEGYIGKYGLGKRNERGQKLVEFCKRQNMVVTNTWYKQEKRRRYTWKAPGDSARYQLDYILTKQRYRNSVKNAKTLPGADADSDHNLVAMTVHLQLKFIRKKKKKVNKWNKEKLKTKSKELEENIEANIREMEMATTEERWRELKETITREAMNTVGQQQGQEPRKPWITEDMIKEMEERRKWKHQKTEEAKKEYRRLNNKLRRTTKKAREKWWEEKCEELEELQAKGKYDQVYERVKKMTKKPAREGGMAVEDKEGKMLQDAEEIRGRWKEYVEELYQSQEKPKNLNDGPYMGTGDDMGPEVLKDEVLAAINDMKNNKAEGADNIPAEILKILGEKATGELIRLCQDIYNTGKWPEDFLQTIMIPIKKKNNATTCKDYRTISLLPHAAKVMLKILTKRIQAKVEAEKGLGEDQFGFRKGRGTRDAIGALRVLTERSLEYGQEVYICFVDYEKAFDRVDWRKLMSALRRRGIDWKDRRLIGNLYMNQKVKIRIDGECSEEGEIGRGVRQGCPLSPLLFNIYIEELMQEAMEDIEEGVKVGGRLIKALRFADDQAMLATTQEGLQKMMDKLNLTSRKYNMKINIGKTKSMRISREEEEVTEKIKINGEEVEQVKSFCYLGSMITTDARCQSDIKRRIAMGKDAFTKRGELLRGGLNKGLKKRLVKTLVWSVALYGSETWTIKKEDIKRLEAFEMWIWRRMEKVSWTEHITNEEVLQMVGEKRSLITTIRERQKNWVGHVLRGDSLLKEIIEGRMEGKRGRGRPRQMMLGGMMVNGYSKLKEKAQHREEWRHWRLEPAEGQRT